MNVDELYCTVRTGQLALAREVTFFSTGVNSVNPQTESGWFPLQ